MQKYLFYDAMYLEASLNIVSHVMFKYNFLFRYLRLIISYWTETEIFDETNISVSNFSNL